MPLARDFGKSNASPVRSRSVPLVVALVVGACSVDREPPDGVPATVTVHSPGVMNPRSDDWHGRTLSLARWSPMIDADDPAACGLCHEGTPARPKGVRLSAPGATACTTCHDEPGGVLACSTCHPAPAGAHPAHIDAARADLACGVCHPVPSEPVISGLHADGAVEIVFDPTIVGVERSFDRRTDACAVSCHDLGGARSRPRWSDSSPMGCGDCHGSPPTGHFSGPCTNCHRDANADGTALTSTSLHMNGRVDVGDGSGKCGACHGEGDDPWPKMAAHPAHRAPDITTPVECGDCHVVPATLHAAGHLDGVVEVVFGGRATERDAHPSWDGTSCDQVACHGAGLPEPRSVTPTWTDSSGRAKACGACHGTPPAVQHTTSTSCDRSTCHGSEVSRAASGLLGITENGKQLHIDGTVEPSL